MLYEPKIKIVLHGYFKELFPHDITLSGSSVAELINGLCKVTKAFNPKLGEEKHCMSIIGFDTKESLFSPIPSNITEIHIVPSMEGGKGGLFKVIIGVAIIAVAIYNPGVLFTIGGFSVEGASLLFTGISLALGGLLEMLSPQPQIDKNGNSAVDPEASKYLGASQNTVKIGTRIPIAYGENKAYGHYLSFNVDAVDVIPTA